MKTLLLPLFSGTARALSAHVFANARTKKGERLDLVFSSVHFRLLRKIATAATAIMTTAAAAMM
jgi:hypothetical protein